MIIETNKTTERIFPAVPDVEHPQFFDKMDKLVKLNNKVRAAAIAAGYPVWCVTCAAHVADAGW